MVTNFLSKSKRFAIKILFISYILILINANNASALPKAINDLIDGLTELTCETQGIGDLVVGTFLRGAYSHTCIQEPFATFAVALIISPIFYPFALLRLKINEDRLFKGACDDSQRAEYKNPRIDFAFCSNVKLIFYRIVAINSGIVNAVIAFFSDGIGAALEEFKKVFNRIDPNLYHYIYRNKTIGDTGVFADIPAIFPWRVIQKNDRICVAVRNVIFTGWIPVGCKFIKEPYTDSIYGEFMGRSGNGQLYQQLPLVTCSKMESCYKDTVNNTHFAVSITAPIVECSMRALTKLLISSEVCSVNIDSQSIEKIKSKSVLFNFQQKMRLTVRAFLSIYVIFLGFRMLLTGKGLSKGEAFVNFAKIIFVMYFSVGINFNESTYDGISGFLLPLLSQVGYEFASWVSSSSINGLCDFSTTSYKGYEQLALWDAIDCRISHYIGLDVFAELINLVKNVSPSFTIPGITSFPIPPYIYLLIPAIYLGNMQLISLAISYPLMIISISAFLVNCFIVSMILIVILSIMAPIFVPMILFQYTKGYFDSWLRLMISFSLQPMAVVAFLIMMFSVYDKGFYGDCGYSSVEISVPGFNAKKKLFFLDKDEDIQKYPIEKKRSCVNSLGYMLNRPYGYAYSNIKDIYTESTSPKDEDSYKSGFPMLDKGVSVAKGLFFNPISMIFEIIKSLLLALLTAILVLYLMYHLSAQLAEFVADITQSISLSNVTINPQSIYNAVQKVVAEVGGAGAGEGAGAGAGAGAGGADGVGKAVGVMRDVMAIGMDNKVIISAGGAKGAGSQVVISDGGTKGAGSQVVISDGGTKGAGSQVIISAGGSKGAGSQVAISSGGAKGAESQVAILSGGAKGTENQVAISDGGTKGAGSKVAISSGGAKGAGSQVIISAGEKGKENVVVVSKEAGGSEGAGIKGSEADRGVSSQQIRNNIEDFFKKENIELEDSRNFPVLSQYIFYAQGHEKGFAKMADPYENMLRHTFERNENLKPLKEKFTKHIEDMVSEPAKSRLKFINSRVLKEIK